MQTKANQKTTIQMKKPLLILTLILSSLLLTQCNTQETNEPVKTLPKEGQWRATLNIQGMELPFKMTFNFNQKDEPVAIINGKEKIAINEMRMTPDSLFLKLPVFDSEIKARLKDSVTLEGSWFNYYGGPDYIIPFTARYGETNRFIRTDVQPKTNITGKWETLFSAGTEDEYEAIGKFEQQGSRLLGTFLTTTGDYRFLEGSVTGDSLFLSCFDGAHAYLFKGQINGDTIHGRFWSGRSWEEPWTAVKNENAKLPDATTLTRLKKGAEINFSLPDADSNIISLHDPAFQNKVVILQIMGSWCPNCKDESILFSQLYNEYHNRGLEIIALSFERTRGDFDKAAKLIKRMKAQLKIPYTICIAGTDRPDTKKILYFIEQIKSYPTSIILDTEGNVVKIHTGFSGPATGDAYTDLARDYRETIELLLPE
jgi:thiol-disulfide isomerase/thioredoxin